VLLLLGGLVAAGILVMRRSVPSTAEAPATKGTSTGEDLDSVQVPPVERFEKQQKELVAVLGSHSASSTPFTAAVFAPQGTGLALLSGLPSEEQIVSLWDWTSGRSNELGKFKGTRTKLEFVANGRMVACVAETHVALY